MCTFPLSAPGAGLVTTSDRTCVGTDIGGAQGIRRCSNRGITGHVVHDGVSGKPLKRGCSKSLVQSPQGSIRRRQSATPMSPWGRGTRLCNEIKLRAADAMKPNTLATFTYLYDNKSTRTRLNVAAPGLNPGALVTLSTIPRLRMHPTLSCVTFPACLSRAVSQAPP